MTMSHKYDIIKEVELFAQIRKGGKMRRFITVLRHAAWTYPVDQLSDQGIHMAQTLGHQLGNYNHVLASEYVRAQQTAQHLGKGQVVTNSAANELVYPETFKTPVEYTQFVFGTHLEEVRAKAEKFLKAITETKNGRTLIVSHRVLMIALVVLITQGRIEADNWNFVDFDNLEGVQIWIEGDSVASVDVIRLREGKLESVADL